MGPLMMPCLKFGLVLSCIYSLTLVDGAGRRRRDGGDRDSSASSDGREVVRPTDVRATFTCMVGYCYVDGHCQRASLVEPVYGCPQGQTDTGEECVWRRGTSDTTCSRGVPAERCAQQGSMCVCETEVDKVAVCPDDTEYDGEKCFEAMESPEHCQLGLTFHRGMCAKVVHSEAKCGEGTEPSEDGRFCERVERVASTLLCPSGSERDGEVCRTTKTIKPTCSEGDVDMGDRCVHYHTALHKCAEGMTWEDETAKCTKRVEVGMQAICPNGGDVNNDCRVVLPGPLKPICTEGVAVDGMCVTSVQSRAQIECPDGYELVHSPTRCVKHIPYDCSEVEWVVVCDDPPVCEDDLLSPTDIQCVPMCHNDEEGNCLPLCSANRRGLEDGSEVVEDEAHNDPCIEEIAPTGTRNLRDTVPGGSAPSASSPQSQQQRNLQRGKRRFRVKPSATSRDRGDRGAATSVSSTEDRLPLCERVPLTEPQVCTQTVEAEISPFCKEGVYTGDGLCSSEVKIDAEMKCVGEVGDDGQCVIVERGQKVFGCPDGYTPNPITRMCTSLQVASATVTCKEGSEQNGQCVSESEKECATADCKVETESDAIVSCPEGYVKKLDKPTRERKGGDRLVGMLERVEGGLGGQEGTLVCEKVELTVPKDVCPPGTETDTELTCMEVVEPTMTSSIMQVAPQMVCPIATQETPKGCVKEERFPVGAECVTEDGGSCVVKSPRVRMCPPGARDQHGHCFVLTSTDAIGVDTVVQPDVSVTEGGDSSRRRRGKGNSTN